MGCPTLLLAILAVSSRHLSLTSGYDSYQADQYHRECLALLIPMLNDRSTLLDEAICAATVILRLYEEISGKLRVLCVNRLYNSTDTGLLPSDAFWKGHSQPHTRHSHFCCCTRISCLGYPPSRISRRHSTGNQRCILHKKTCAALGRVRQG